MITLPKIEGIRQTSEHAKSLSGALSLPVEFDRNKYAAKWVEKGFQTQQAMQEQHISATIIADGWIVWKHKSQICQRILSGKAYILMCRPKELQQQINAICGNLSREKVVREHSGQTSSGQPLEDHGILSTQELQAVERDPESSESLSRALPLNQIKPLGSQATEKPKRKLFSIK